MGQEGGERVRRVQVVVATGLPKDETWDGDVGERTLCTLMIYITFDCICMDG